ncbi:transcriptional regulator, RpiR family [Burkholderia sp. D7]|nr:transcriptional regulator, RpiR family [Burkholderia sp. D7]
MQNNEISAHLVGPRLRMLATALTPLENAFLRTILDADFIETTPLKDVADRVGMSEAMVVKTAKKFGFSGFRELRQSVAAYNRLPVNEMHKELLPTDSSAEILTKVFRTAIKALEETLAILDIQAFDKAVTLLAGARQRDFYGLGGSAQIARDAVHKFLRIGIRSTAYDDTHLMLMSASLLTHEDVVLIVSHSGQTTAVIEAAKVAQSNKASIIALTNYSDSPLAGLSDAVLCSTAQGSPLMGENAAARIAQLNIIDALFVATAQRDYATAEDHLARTMGVVAHKRR